MTFELECPICRIGTVAVEVSEDGDGPYAEVIEGCIGGCIMDPLTCAELHDEAISAESEAHASRYY